MPAADRDPPKKQGHAPVWTGGVLHSGTVPLNDGVTDRRYHRTSLYRLQGFSASREYLNSEGKMDIAS